MIRGQLSRIGGQIGLVAALAVVGGLSSVGLSRGGPALCTMVALPGGLQWLAGIHVLPLIIAAGLIRKPGAAVAAGLLKGVVELLAGSSHGLLVAVYAGLAGLVIDLVFLLIRRRDRFAPNLLAGGLGTASNIAVLACVTGRPGYCQMTMGAVPLLAISFTSGVVLAGWLGWMLAHALTRLRLVGRAAATSAK